VEEKELNQKDHSRSVRYLYTRDQKPY